MLKLHHAPNSRAGRIVWLLEELRLPYELNRMEFHPRALKSDEHRARHPLGRVPVLEDGEVMLYESGAIVEYVIARHTDGALRPGPHSPLFPRYLQWFNYCEGMVMPPVNTIVVQTILLPPERRSEEALGQARRLLTKALEPVNAALEGCDYLIGDLSGADFMLGHACYMARKVGCMPSELVHAHAYVDRLEARPAFQKGIGACEIAVDQPNLQPAIPGERRMSDTQTYSPPSVWQWDKSNGGRFAAINRPVAGATHDKELPVGRHPMQLYSLGTPNGVKVTVLLEELLALGHVGAEYDAWLIRIGDGDQFSSGFVAANPNSKIPALVDHSGPDPVRVFESGAILVYLAEKFDAFLPGGGAARAECLSWLFWQMGSAPFLGGGFGHFYAYAPSKMAYPIDRYAMEVKRQMDVLDRRLAESPYLAGEDYTIADIAVWPWYGALAKGQLYEAGEFLQVQTYSHVLRWTDRIAQRPAVRRGRIVNRTWGKPESQLPERHEASDFDAKVSP